MTTPATPTQDTNYWRSTGRLIAWTARAIGYFVYFYVIAVEMILGLGFFLLLFGANSSPSFVQWVYRSLDRAMEPFRGIFTPIELGTTAGNDVQSVFDTSILFAMIIYAIVAVAVHAFINWLTQRLRALDRAEHDEQMAALIDHTYPAPIVPSTTQAPQPPAQP